MMVCTDRNAFDHPDISLTQGCHMQMIGAHCIRRRKKSVEGETHAEKIRKNESKAEKS